MAAANESLADLVRYSAWASKKLLGFAAKVPVEDVERAIPNSHGGILKTFQHIYYADRVWAGRLEKAEIAQFEDPAPGPSLADLDKAWGPVLERLAVCAGTNEPGAMVTFTRLNGEKHTVEFHKIVHHVVNHGTYHRGQVAAMLRQSGHAPPSTDLLFYELSGK